MAKISIIHYTHDALFVSDNKNAALWHDGKRYMPELALHFSHRAFIHDPYTAQFEEIDGREQGIALISYNLTGGYTISIDPGTLAAQGIDRVEIEPCFANIWERPTIPKEISWSDAILLLTHNPDLYNHEQNRPARATLCGVFEKPPSSWEHCQII